MKKIIQSLILVLTLALVAPSLQSCNKYEEGPSISLRSKKARVANTWKVAKYEVNGNDATDLVKDYTYEMTKDGKVTITSPNGDKTEGTWEFNDDKTALIVTTGGSADTWTLTKLKNDEMNIEYTDGNGNKHRAEYVSV